MRLYRWGQRSGKWIKLASGRYWARIQKVSGGTNHLVDILNLEDAQENFELGDCRLVGKYQKQQVIILRFELYSAEIFIPGSSMPVKVEIEAITDCRAETEKDTTFGIGVIRPLCEKV